MDFGTVEAHMRNNFDPFFNSKSLQRKINFQQLRTACTIFSRLRYCLLSNVSFFPS